MTELHIVATFSIDFVQQSYRYVIFFIPIHILFAVRIVRGLLLCLHLNGILIDPPYLWDTFAAPSKRAREIDFVEVSEAKRYPSELIIVQNLHGTRTVGSSTASAAAASADAICEKIAAFSQQQGHAPVLNFIHYTQTH